MLKTATQIKWRSSEKVAVFVAVFGPGQCLPAPKVLKKREDAHENNVSIFRKSEHLL
jgi:hypothetical protein